MVRTRYLSTDVSTDVSIVDLTNFGILPVLLYTWAIPHADDSGALTGDVAQFKRTVCPILDVSVPQVDEALDQIASVGLWQRRVNDGNPIIEFDPHRWRREQGNRTRDEWNYLRHKLAPQVYERDNYRCVYCGSDAQLTCDHIYPLSRGGSNDLTNLVTCCKSCNSAKQARTPEEWAR